MSRMCFLFGNRDTPAWVFPELLRAVEIHYIKHNVRKFVVGHYGGFDSMAIRALVQLKERYPDISLQMLLPYPPGRQPVVLPAGFSGTVYPFSQQDAPGRSSIVQANQRMLDAADTVICYVARTGNTQKLLHYACLRTSVRELLIQNLASNFIP